MPAPIQITLESKVYSVPILNGEMDNLVNEIQQARERILDYAENRRRDTERIEEWSKILLLIYIQQEGTFPSSTPN